MTAAMHLDLAALDRELARLRAEELLLVIDDQGGEVLMRCEGCGVTTLVPNDVDIYSGQNALDRWNELHARCGGKR